MKIGRLKKKLRNPRYVRKLLNKFLDQEKQWNRYRTFECNAFFVGHESAKFNQLVYDLKAHKVAKKIRFLKKLWLKDHDFEKYG